MLAIPVILLMVAATGCEEALAPVAAALRQNELAKVRTMLDAIRSQCSRSSAFHELSGIAGELTGSSTAAAEDFQQAFALNPQLSDDPAVLLWFARSLVETNQSARLTAFLANRHRGLSPPLLFSLGALFAEHRDYAQAIRYFQQIPVEAADDAVYFNLGLAHSHLRQFGEARKNYFLAIDKHPGHVEAYFRVGLDYAASGAVRKAIPWLFRARDFAPARPDIAYALIEQLLPLRYLDTAAQLATEAVTANPRDPLLLLAHGDVLLARGDTTGAAGQYQRALTLQPRLTGALVGLGRVEAAKGNNGEARRILLDALSMDPENSVASGELGSIEAQDGDWADAYPHLSRAWSSDQSNPTAGLQLARALRHLKRPAEGLRILEPLALVLRDSSAFHSELAQIYAQLGRNTDAQAERARLAALQAQAANGIRFEDPRVYVH
jgi:tetratricopeptide (TPR) repeat protein